MAGLKQLILFTHIIVAENKLRQFVWLTFHSKVERPGSRPIGFAKNLFEKWIKIQALLGCVAKMQKQPIIEVGYPHLKSISIFIQIPTDACDEAIWQESFELNISDFIVVRYN